MNKESQMGTILRGLKSINTWRTGVKGAKAMAKAPSLAALKNPPKINMKKFQTNMRNISNKIRKSVFLSINSCSNPFPLHLYHLREE